MHWGTDHEDVQIYDPESKKLDCREPVDLTEFGKQNGWFHAGYGGRYNINWSAVKVAQDGELPAEGRVTRLPRREARSVSEKPPNMLLLETQVAYQH